jgi:hypothetical protein
VNLSVGRRRALSILICFLIGVEFGIAGQNDAALKIVVTRGGGAQNVISQPSGPISVRVTDSNDRPVAGATVVFTTPASGPGGDFVNSNSVIVFTDGQGLAAVPQYRANSAVGSYQIQVRAAYMSRAATISIAQTNIATQKSSRKAIMIAALAGGAAAVAFAAKGGGGGGGGDQSPSTPPVVTPPTVSAPPTIVFGGSAVSGPR